MPQTMSEVITGLNTQRDAVLVELAAITDALTDLITNPKVTYTVSGDHGSQSFDWNGYQNYLLNLEKACIEKLERLIELVNKLQPYQFVSRVI